MAIDLRAAVSNGGMWGCLFSVVPIIAPQALLGCAADTSPDMTLDSQERDAAPPPGCADVELAPPADGVQLQLALPVPAATEVHECQLVMLDRDINVNRGVGYYTEGSHHGTVSRTGYHGQIPTRTLDGKLFDGDPTKPHPCPLGGGQGWDVRGGFATGIPAVQRDVYADAGNYLPDNVAVPLKKGDVVMVDFHMVNTREEPIEACFKMNLVGIPDEDVAHEAGRFVLYNLHVTVPPGGRSSARMACPVTTDAKLLTAVNHMHARGVRARARLWDSKPGSPDARMLMALYDQDQWAEPPPVVFDEPVSLRKGQWIEWSCDYENPEPRPVSQGTATTDEMCTFVGAYFPRDIAMEGCGDPETGERLLAGIVLADGELDGQGFLDCFLSSPRKFTGRGDDRDRYVSQECFTNTCAAVSPLTQPFLRCLRVHDTPSDCRELYDELVAAECEPTEEP